MPLSRRKTRRFTLQYLYATWAYADEYEKEGLLLQFEDDTTFLDEKYLVEAQDYITKNLSYLLGIIQHFGPKFDVHSLPLVNLIVLLIGLFELLSEVFDDIPPNVAINEALELAKKYSDEGSKNFINGILNSVLENLDDLKKKQLSIKEIDWDVFRDELATSSESEYIDTSDKTSPEIEDDAMPVKEKKNLKRIKLDSSNDDSRLKIQN